MSEPSDPKTELNPPITYQVRLKGHLSTEWAEWFGGLTFTSEANGETLISGATLDQPALHGLLKKVRDMGLTLISVNPVNQNSGDKK